MIALAYCRMGPWALPGFALGEAAPGLGLILAPAAPDPADRLRHCLALQSAVPGLCPLALRSQVGEQAARGFARAHRGALLDRLRALEGRFEAILDLEEGAAPGPVPVAEGGWLRQRAALLQAREAAGRQAMDRLRAFAAPLEAEAERAARGPGYLRLSLLLPEARLPALRDLVSRGGPAGLTVSAPWPAFSFCEIGAAP